MDTSIWTPPRWATPRGVGPTLAGARLFLGVYNDNPSSSPRCHLLSCGVFWIARTGRESLWNAVVMGDTRDAVWARFGAEVRRLRELAGRTQTDLGRSALMAKATMSAIERGTRAPKQHQAEALDTALSTGGALERLRRDLADQQSAPEWFRDALLIEQRAQTIREYEPMVVPGILQTADYAEAMIRARHTRKTTEETNELVRIRTERLANIQDNRPLLLFVVRETVLSQIVGNEMIMKGQLERIAQLGEQDTIRLQVLPHTPTTAGLCSHFRISTLSPTQAVVYFEHPLGGTTHESPEHVEEMSTLFGQLQAEALSPNASLDLIRKTHDDLQRAVA
ncbi:helix-turn-helix transcriptional regulator [Lipingzhangella sp. LS1_29]|uniref:Helix-turn-helix transcriptional regulator n=1 Tax=Lipingzhangella rawalii TaxID=2055835 RepID=A0ABU2HAV9_9ACTN|nr:helix-turn-helix transcriptional regulator [Lipingzhangella rawalii]MDS1272442.1 helix-turn-helix transcriptional regulator [Lipingzhangella rawalii]